MPRIRVAACQINTVVGDLVGNVERVIDALAAAGPAGADLAVFPELTVTGYPPEDLLGRPAFVDGQSDSVRVGGRGQRRVRSRCRIRGRGAIGTAVERRRTVPGGRGARSLRQAHPAQLRRVRRAALVRPGFGSRPAVRGGRHPGRDDHLRGHVVPGWPHGRPGRRWGASYWSTSTPRPIRVGAARSASPCSPPVPPKPAARVVYVNQVGGQDELVFDGASVVVDGTGRRRRLGPPVRRGGAGGRCRGRASTRGRRTGVRYRCRCRPPPDPGRRSTAAGRRPAGPGGRGLRGARARDPRLPGQERVLRRGDRAVRRHRLVVGGGGGRRRHGERAMSTGWPCRRGTRARAR